MHPTRDQSVVPQHRTLTQALFANAEEIPDGQAVSSSDGRVNLTWSEYAELAGRTAAGLTSIGVEPGDTVALLMGNRPEWQVADIGALLAGATPFSLYPSAPASQNADLLHRSGARVLIADAALLAGWEVADDVTVVVLDEDAAAGLTLAELQQASSRGAAGDLSGNGTGVATLIFTSGTTGAPKAVEIGQEAIQFMATALQAIRPMRGGRHISYLPHAHIVDRMTGHYLPLLTASSITTVLNPMTIFQELAEIRPTFFTSVPRIWQRLETHLRSEIDALPPTDRDTVIATISAAAAASDRTERSRISQSVPWIADVRRRFGLDATDWLLTGSAPLPAETHRFFAGIGMPLHDCWGLSETVAVATVTTPDDHRIGTVGRTLPGTEVVLAADGEILVRGPHLARVYRGDPEATAATFDAEGWFHTGDLGHWVDEHLELVGRKKEMMISTGGENMSPSRIESVLLNASSIIKEAVVVGDGRPFNVALIVPDADAVKHQLGLDITSGTDALDETLTTTLAAAVESANQHLSRAERVRKFIVIRREWSLDRGEITPTLKLRRTGIESSFAQQIDDLYQL